MFIDVSTEVIVLFNLSKIDNKVFSIDFTNFFFSKNFLKEDIRFYASASSLDCTIFTCIGGVEGVIVIVAIGALVVATSML